MIDWSQTSALKEEIGAEDFDEVIALFLEEVSEVTARLADAVCLDTLEADMHFLKGSALSLGFSAFAAKCHEGEILAAQGRLSDVDVPGVLHCFETSKRFFLIELPTSLVG